MMVLLQSPNQEVPQYHQLMEVKGYTQKDHYLPGHLLIFFLKQLFMVIMFDVGLNALQLSECCLPHN